MTKQSRALPNLAISVLAAYCLLSIKSNSLVPLYKLFSEQVLGLQFIVYTFVSLALLLTAQQWLDKRSLIKAVMSKRKHGKLNRLVTSGINDGCFAYLTQEEQYGVAGKLPPMSVVYVVAVSSDMNRAPTAWVVPKFKGQVVGPELSDMPSLAIEVPISRLYKHVPAHLIPEIV